MVVLHIKMIGHSHELIMAGSGKPRTIAEAVRLRSNPIVLRVVADTDLPDTETLQLLCSLSVSTSQVIAERFDELLRILGDGVFAVMVEFEEGPDAHLFAS
jgi:hypothetical protein